MLTNYKQEIRSLVTNGFEYPVLGENEKYHILYITQNLVNQKIYIGVHSSKKLVDRYLGCGVYGVSDITKSMCGQSKFVNSIKKYGVKNFKRENLLYFLTREEMFLAERLVVTENFLKRKDSLNSMVGGSCPPFGVGEKNSNFGHYWSFEKKKVASLNAKKTKRSVGGRNPRAVACILTDTRDRSILEFSTLGEASLAIGLKEDSLRIIYYDNGIVVCGKFYVVIDKKLYLSLKEALLLDQKIEEAIKKSRFKNTILQYYDSSKRS